MICLGLLLAGVDRIDRAAVESQTHLFVAARVGLIEPVIFGGHRQPIHHVARVVYAVEGFKYQIGKLSVKQSRHSVGHLTTLHRLHGIEFFHYILAVAYQQRCVKNRHKRTVSYVTPAAVVSHQSCERRAVVKAGRHNDRAAEYAHILRQMIEFLETHFHRHLHLHHITVMPLAIKSDI